MLFFLKMKLIKLSFFIIFAMVSMVLLLNMGMDLLNMLVLLLVMLALLLVMFLAVPKENSIFALLLKLYCYD